MPKSVARVGGAALGFALAGAAFGQVADRVAETIAANTFELTVSEAGLGGAGGELLLSEAAAASFLCLGEAHLTNEIPALLSAALPALRGAGYSAYAIETGERIAQRVAGGILDDPEGTARIFAELPFTAPFIDRAAEFELIRKAAGLRFDVWGIDQVFAGGARFNLQELRRVARTDEARELSGEMLGKAQAALLHFVQTGDDSRSFLASATAGDYDRLRGAFRGNEEALRVIDELEVSARIYALFGAGRNYESNHERINLMTRHFAERVRSLPEGEKAILKFGEVHMGRGYTALNQLDLGNAAVGMGELRGGGSLHVHVLATESARSEGVRDLRETSPLRRALAASMGDREWVVVDLRSLRPIFHRERNRRGFEELADEVWRYDLVALTRRFTSAEMLPGVPSPPGE